MLSSGYFLLIAVTLIIGLGASGYVNSQLKKYSRVGISNGLTGAEAARALASTEPMRAPGPASRFKGAVSRTEPAGKRVPAVQTEESPAGSNMTGMRVPPAARTGI